MDYKEKYNELVEAIRVLQKTNPSDGGIQNWVNDNVPELAEPQDEKVRKWLYDYFRSLFATWIHPDITCEEILAWLEKQGETFTKKDVDNAYIEGMAFAKNELEKQGEQKPADKVEPKFKIGDWVVTSYGKVNQVIAVDEDCDGFTLDDDTYFSGSWKDSYHLWTIQDAKDGDVLYFSDETIVIFKDLYNATTFHSYCHIEDGIFNISKDDMPDWWEAEGFKPATKEQCGVLFQKMKESGYEWNNEKKELKKIEQKSAIGDIDKMIDDYANNKERGNEEFGKPVPCMVRAYKQGLEDAVSTFNLSEQNLAWNEEDEKNLAQCIEAIDACYKWDSMIDWLKSLRSRSRWKPSEEQMRALHDMNLTGNISYAGQGQVLMELYNDLEKL